MTPLSLPSEAERLAALYEHCLLDTPPDDDFDALVRLAAQLCGVPIAAVSLIDSQRQWFKSIMGIQATEVPRQIAFCTHTILQDELLVVQDAEVDSRFQDNPLVTNDPHVRFYAGMPLVTDDGHAIGTLCVADKVPRGLTAQQEESLRMLAQLAASQFRNARRVAEREHLVSAKESLLQEQEALITERSHLIQERERAEAELAQSHLDLAESAERLRRLTDAAFEGISISQDGKLVDASPAYAALFGYNCPADLIGVVAKDLAAPESRALVASKIDNCDEEPYDAVMQRQDGTTFHAELRGRQAQLGGRPARISAVRDITGRKAMEEALNTSHMILQQSESRLAEAQRIAKVGSWEYDLETKKSLWSEELFRLFGLNPAENEPTSEGLVARCHPDDMPLLRALSIQAMQDCLPYELDLRILQRNGTFLWTHAVGHAETDEFGSVIRLSGTLMDIQARKMAEERFRVLFEQSSHPHLLFNENGGIIDCNSAALSLLNCTEKNQLWGLHPAKLSPEFQPDGQRSDEKSLQMDALAWENGFHRFEWMHRKLSGEPVLVEVTLTHATVENHPVMLVVWHDLTEQRALEQEREQLLNETQARSEREALLNRISQVLRSSIDPQMIQEKAAAMVGEALKVDRCYFSVYDPQIHAVQIMHDWHRSGLTSLAGEYRLAEYREYVDTLYAEGTAVIPDVRDYCGATVVREVLGCLGISALLAVPLFSQGKFVAALSASMNGSARVWTPGEVSLMESVLTQTRMAVETASIHQRERRIAQQLQAALQPALPEQIPGLSIASFTQAALEEALIGGDFYDCFSLDDNLYALVIGDVSGKGLAAAQQLALIRNSLRTTLYLSRDPVQAAADLNAIVTAHDLLLGFVTVFVGLYDVARGVVTYASCGHEAVLLRRSDGTVEHLGATGLPLGVDQDAVYTEGSIVLASGDTLLLYTDGLSEAGPSRDDLLGTDGAARLFAALPHGLSIESEATMLLDQVSDFSGGVFRDDVTAVLMRRQ